MIALRRINPVDSRMHRRPIALPRWTLLPLVTLLFAVMALSMGCAGEKKKKTDKGGDKAATPTEAPPAPANPAATDGTDPGQPAAPIGPEARRKKLEDAIKLKTKMTAAPADVAAPPKSAKKSKSGLAWKILRKGSGSERAGRDDTVWVHYSSWAKDGGLIFSTWKKGEPTEKEMATQSKGWAEVLPMMAVGERRRVWMSPKLAHPRHLRKKRGARTMDIELVRLRKAPPPPSDVAKPPKDAEKTASGLAYRVLKAGTGKEHPAADGSASVRYSGWTTKGRFFDGTDGDESRTVNMGSVIAGWTEGLQLMVVGQKSRFWIPEKLAYNGMPKKPKGMLVFDVELVEIPK